METEKSALFVHIDALIETACLLVSFSCCGPFDTCTYYFYGLNISAPCGAIH